MGRGLEGKLRTATLCDNLYPCGGDNYSLFQGVMNKGRGYSIIARFLLYIILFNSFKYSLVIYKQTSSTKFLSSNKNSFSQNKKNIICQSKIISVQPTEFFQMTFCLWENH